MTQILRHDSRAVVLFLRVKMLAVLLSRYILQKHTHDSEWKSRKINRIGTTPK